MSSIPWANLSRTFQDAVTIALRLRIEYLWIDSLCIVQHPNDYEWAPEAAKMGAIYENAFLVIAATSALDGRYGCLNTRLPPTNLTADNSAGGTVMYARKPINHSGFNTGPEPIFTRAWCHQELLLAQRVLHCHEQEFIWECRSASWCECEPRDELGDHLRTKEEPFALFAPPANPSLHKSAEDFLQSDPVSWRKSWDVRTEEPTEALRIWLNIIESYSKRQLSRETDRLPALSALAQRAKRHALGTYLAGMWTRQLPFQLCWCLIAPLAIPTSASTSFVAPSWSWASAGTNVFFPIHASLQLQYRPLAEVLRKGTGCVPKNTEDSYGAVASGCLTIRGPLIDGVMQAKTSGRKPSMRIHLPSSGRSKRGYHEIVFSVCLDRIGEDPAREYDEERVVCLLLMVSSKSELCHNLQPDDGCEYSGIILRSSSAAPNAYERIGLACFCAPADVRLECAHEHPVLRHTPLATITVV
ncbi:hypothetical protein H2203_007114 [Taxawa tesnikishii (nom. ined.)]|nr:hypothetical protein H2203_007114 [Dothideales sp. JES 119]